MAAGGATWDTAGALEVGSGNTFAAADATEDLDIGSSTITDVGWWAFTPTVSTRVGILRSPWGATRSRLYRGATLATKVLVDAHDFVDLEEIYYAQEGVTYHLVIGTGEGEIVPASYQATRDPDVTLAASPWNSALRDREDNQLVISPDRELETTLNGPEFQSQSWVREVIDGSRPPGRVSVYGAIEDFGGPPVSGAAACIWSHALWGDNGGTGPWGGVCPLLITGIADIGGNTPPVSYALDAEDTDNPFADVATAEIALASRALYFLPVRDNVDQRGVFSHPDPELEGYSVTAEIEWETPTIELVKVEITGDLPVRPADATVSEGISVSLRDKIRPAGGGGIWPDGWRKGIPGEWDGVTRDGGIVFTYRDGDPDWTEITGVVSGEDGWEGFADYTTDATPDEIALIGMESAFGGGPGGGSGESFADVALRFTLRSPRYRWVYERTTTAIPYRRGWPRHQGTTAARGTGGRDDIQSGPRGIGAVV